MRLFAFLAIAFTASVAQAADVPALLIDTQAVASGDQGAKLKDVVQAHFGATLNLAAAQQVICSRSPDVCTMVEIGQCSRAQFATALVAGAQARVVSPVVGDVVNYQRNWGQVPITAGDRQSKMVAFLTAVHPTIDLEFLKKIEIVRKSGGIESAATFLTVVDDLELAQLSFEGKLVGLPPQ